MYVFFNCIQLVDKHNKTMTQEEIKELPVEYEEIEILKTLK